MNASPADQQVKWRGALVGAALFCAFGILLHLYLLESPPALVWLAATFGMSGALVGYLGMRNAFGVVGASIGLALGLFVGAIIGDEAGFYLQVDEPGSCQEGQILDIAGETLDGQPFNVKEWRGKVVLVDFWATWCPPCLAELPNLKQAFDRYHKDGFEIVGIPLDVDRDRLVDFLKGREIPWVQLFSAEPSQREWNNPLARKYHVRQIPTMYLLDKQGMVAPVDPRGEALVPAIERLLVGGDVTGSPSDRGVHIGLFPMGLLIGACIGGYVGIHLGDFAEKRLRRKRTPAEIA
jgi:thiol-disulfide isomerase/thioredoxin